MTSRLDRLFLLLEQGGSLVTKKAAALQLGEVQKAHPGEFHNLLRKLRQYLHSNSWDTRIAASLAVEAIIKHVPKYFPNGCLQDQTNNGCDNPLKDIQQSRITFDGFCVDKIIRNGTHLLGSEGKEYDTVSSAMDNCGNENERLLAQRRLINQKLGLDIAERLQLGMDEIFTNEDLQTTVDSSNKIKSESTTNISDFNRNGNQQSSSSNAYLVANDATSVTNRLRSRTQSSKLKRSVSEAQKENGFQPEDFCKSFRPSKKIKQEPKESNGVCKTEEEEVKEDEQEIVIDFESADDWPLRSFCEQLMNDLFHPSWEIRHGSATALREIVKEHGRCGGRTNVAFTSQMEDLNQCWLEDLSLRLVCVLALDKFGDFLSDQVVAPVRETCAQALGSIFKHFSTERTRQMLNILQLLLKRPEWEARHGALLSIKYLLAIRQDLTEELLPVIFDSLFDCLKDSVDDVSSVAAAALVPVKEKLFEILPEKICTLISYLWDALVDIDELTSSTGNILMLLSSLLSHCIQPNLGRLNQLVPRLWPFLDHSLSSVRKSVLEAFIILIESSDLEWMQLNLLSDSLRLIYQRCLVEESIEIQPLLYRAWQILVTRVQCDILLNATRQFLSGWIYLMMYPARVAIDSSTCAVWMDLPTIVHQASTTSDSMQQSAAHSHKRYFIGAIENAPSHTSFKNESITQARIQAAKFIALLASRLVLCQTKEPPTSFESLISLFIFHLNSKSAVQRICICWILQEWARIRNQPPAPCTTDCSLDMIVELPNNLIEKLMACLQELLYYDEIASSFTRIQHETRDFIANIRANQIPLDDSVYKPGAVYSLNLIGDLLDNAFPAAFRQSKHCKSKLREELNNRKQNLSKSLASLVKYQNELTVVCTASLASALIAWNYTPEKLNPVVRPLMESIKKEENVALQSISAQHLALLLNICVQKNPQPISKIIKNLITFLCSDPNFTPPIKTGVIPLEGNGDSNANGTSNGPSCSMSNANAFAEQCPMEVVDLITLANLQKSTECNTRVYRRTNSQTANKKSVSEIADETIEINTNSTGSSVASSASEETDKQNEIYRKGATFALVEICKYFGDDLSTKISPLWENVFSIDNLNRAEEEDHESVQKLLQALQLLEVIASSLSENGKQQVKTLFEPLCVCLQNRLASIRHLASRCFGVLALLYADDVMEVVIDRVLVLLQSSENEFKRKGAVECIFHVIDKLEIKIVPYISLLVIPMMGRMSDQNELVRLLATQCFAQLVKLMPLDVANNSKKDNQSTMKSEFLLKRKKDEQNFLEQLLNPKALSEYKLPMPVKAELRTYQQDGINWLAFLNQYRLHGILCDEMGLGKTLMSICILAADHFYRNEQQAAKLPSLVICPPTLTGHWVYEVKKFVDQKYLHPIDYIGTPTERNCIRNKLNKSLKANGKYNLVVASYDIVRNDIEFFSSISWNYCILDEGHVIKNGKTKMAKAIKTLNANHRLILTGTPIQNNVLELWSLFDFLMPGYLGTERQFVNRYSKPILASRDAKSSSKEQEAGVLAMESLHGQVLPFILRRMKEDVLKDLPPKIIQDYYCELSPLQTRLYEDFAKSKAKKSLEEDIDSDDESQTVKNASKQVHSHVFQALQYLKRVCNHPKLVLSSQHPEYSQISNLLKEQKSSLNEIGHAAKLGALRQLLLDCGIGLQTSNSVTTEPIVSQHRALVFCQMKSMLDIVENDLLKLNMPSISYLRLDGSVPVCNRQSIVHRFNNDPSIDLLLLTTQVGGLGLNLTGADVVIFVEHDWNPMKDLQAMDRAHRIGQKKVVNVYRLITSGTLEEKIMGLQKFKLQIANTVISQDNSSLETMGTDHLFDLFQLDKGQSQNSSKLSGDDSKQEGRRSMKSVLEGLPEIWDTEQYEKEYDLSEFINSLSN